VITQHIVIVEDDHLQEGPLEQTLQRSFPESMISTVKTEHEFRSRMDAFRREPPDVVVMDVMLRWTDPSPSMEQPPSEVIAGGYYRAGLRCASLLEADRQLRNVPVIFYTVVERTALEREGTSIGRRASYLRKSPDATMLVKRIRDVSQGRGV
jgi:DNA-binding NarL/FixJ family response regulator